MIRIARSVALPVSFDQAWSVVRAIDNIQSWHPAVQACSILSNVTGGVGAIRKIGFFDGMSFTEEVVGISDSERRLILLVREGPFQSTMICQTLTLFCVVEGGGSLLHWELRADAPPFWLNKICKWFGDGFISAGLCGLTEYFSVNAATTGT